MSRKRRADDSWNPYAPSAAGGVSRDETDAAWEEMRESWQLESIGEHSDLADQIGQVLIEKSRDYEIPERSDNTNHDRPETTKLAAFASINQAIYDKLSTHPHITYAMYALQDNHLTFKDANAVKKFLREEAGLELLQTQSDEEREQTNLWKLRFVTKEVQQGELEENDETNPLTATLPAKGEKMHSFHKKPTAEQLAMNPELALSPEQSNPVTLMLEVQDEETLSSLIEDYAGIELSIQTFPEFKIAKWIMTYG